VYDSQEARDMAAREAALEIVEAVLTAKGKCCARCRRGTKAHGETLPCGYDYRCPNPKCDHPRRTR
jgi:hypothetical protein